MWSTSYKLNLLLTPESAVLRPHRDVDAIVLSSALCQRLLQGPCVQHETIIEAASDVIHLSRETLFWTTSNNWNSWNTHVYD